MIRPILSFKQSVIILFLLTSPLYAKTEITFWHSMAGPLGIITNKLVNEFNRNNAEYKVIPIYKGNYNETLTALVAAFHAKKQPTIAQVYEIATATMLNPKGIIVPVHTIFSKDENKYVAKQIIPTIYQYYSNNKGELQALPFNSSSAVMYYNKTSLNTIKNRIPKTWPELENVSKQLLKKGYTCGFTTAWPSWTQVESFSAWNNLAFATQRNGFKSLDSRLLINKQNFIFHQNKMRQWIKKNIFVYGGREDNAGSLFTSGKCQFFITSSGSYGSLKKTVSFQLGVSMLPYWPQMKGSPNHSLMGGAALWVLSGHSKKEYQGVSEFFTFLLQAKIQAYWQRQTGYLPVTINGYKINKENGYYEKIEGADIAIKELMHQSDQKNDPQGIRLGYYPQIRDVIEEELEAIWSGGKSPSIGLNNAVKRGNRLLKRFKKTVMEDQ